MSRREVRWGILGCGAVTETKSGPAFQRAPRSKLVAVMRRSGALAADFARRHGVPRWYDDADRLIADPEVDAVYIATPPGSHLAYAQRVCAAGKPAYVEKPMARNFAECAQMVETFARAQIPLFVAYYRRALPRFLEVKARLDAGAIGRITGVSVRFSGPYHRQLGAPERGTADSAPCATCSLPWRYRAEESGGGLLLDLGCHTLDILDFLLGPVELVSGVAANTSSACDVEDSVAMSFRLTSGALGSALWNFASDERKDEVVLEGDEGFLRFATFGDAPLELGRGRDLTRLDVPNPPHIQEPMITSVVGELVGEGPCASTGISAARTQRVMDHALEGYYGGRQRAFWTDPASWPGRRTA